MLNLSTNLGPWLKSLKHFSTWLDFAEYPSYQQILQMYSIVVSGKIMDAKISWHSILKNPTTHCEIQFPSWTLCKVSHIAEFYLVYSYTYWDDNATVCKIEFQCLTRGLTFLRRKNETQNSFSWHHFLILKEDCMAPIKIDPPYCTQCTICPPPQIVNLTL